MCVVCFSRRLPQSVCSFEVVSGPVMDVWMDGRSGGCGGVVCFVAVSGSESQGTRGQGPDNEMNRLSTKLINNSGDDVDDRTTQYE